MTNIAQEARLDGRLVEAVLIDAGGVLVDPNWVTVVSVLDRHGVHADPDDLAAADPLLKRELDDAEVIRSSTDVTRRERWLARLLHHAGIGGDRDAVEAATDELEAMHLERGIWDLVIDGAADALDRLRAAGLRLSLASNAEPLLRARLGELGLAHRFDHLAISGEVGVEKPDSRFFAGALEAIRTAPARAIHVGDLYEVDVVGARAAGLEAVLVDVADLSADREVTRIRSLAELPRLLGVG
jgi:putative hydrolase of the HAD superfamily